MIDCNLKSRSEPWKTVSGLILLSLLGSCADKTAIHEADQERYRKLENEIISAQQEEVQRRRAEERVARRLQRLDADRAAAALQRLKTDTRSDTDPWALEQYPDPVDGLPMCALVSDVAVVKNGHVDTRTHIVIGKSRIFLRTDARFDPLAPDTGFRVDAGIPIAFDHFINELTAVVDSNYDRLISTLQAGSSLAVSFAFMPQLSSTDTHVIDINLQNLEEALSTLNACRGQNSGLPMLENDVPASS